MSVETFTTQDFEAFLASIRPNGKYQLVQSEGEICFILEVDAQSGIYIRTSIMKDGVSAPAGRNSIRVYPVYLPGLNPMGSKLDRWIQRTSGWRTHLRENIETFLLWREMAGNCRDCNQPNEMRLVKKLGPNTGRPFAACFEHYGETFVWLDDEKEIEDAKRRLGATQLAAAGAGGMLVPALQADGRGDDTDSFGDTGIESSLVRQEFGQPSTAPFEAEILDEPGRSLPRAFTEIFAEAEDPAELDVQESAPTDRIASPPQPAIPFSPRIIAPSHFRLLPSPFTPSEYQRDFYYMLQNSEKNIVMVAVAGSGKSSTEFQGLSYFHPSQNVAYAAFNKSIAAHGKKVAPANVKVGTFHSFAMSIVLRQTGAELMVSGGKDDDKEDKMDVVYSMVTHGANKGQRFVTIRLVGLCKSMLMEPTEENLDWLVDRYNIDIPETAHDLIYTLVHECYWESIRMNDRAVDFNDLIWMIATDKVRVRPYDVFVIDEAQDLDPAQIRMALRMGKRIAAVGDPNQCQPAGTMVATCKPGNRWHPSSEIVWKPIESIVEGDSIVAVDRHGHTLAKSAKVNQVAQRPYAGQMISVTANSSTSRCTSNHKWIVRWNKSAENKWCTYLMQKGPYFCVGVTAMFRQAPEYKNNPVFGLGQRARQERADAAWILKVHDTKQDAVLYEQVLTSKYGLPHLMFHPVHNTIHFTQTVIDPLYRDIGNLERKAKQCLSDHRRELAFPLYTKRQNGSQKRQGRYTSFETQACNLISEYMLAPTLKNKQRIGVHETVEWHPIHVESEWSHDVVYSLDVAKHHNYIADGLVTCNSIYAFRGADSEAMPKLIHALHAHVMPLSICYRCPKSSIRLAQKYVPQIEWRPDAPEGILADVKTHAPQPGDLNISRVNAALVKPCLDLIRRGVNATIVGRDIGKSIKGLLHRGKTLCDTDSLPVVLRVLATYTEMEVAKLVAANKLTRAEFVQDQFNTLTAISDACYSMEDVERKIDSTFSDLQSQIRFSSVHRAKGLEADRVHILKPDLLPMVRKGQQPWEYQQELNVTYVAYTRNKKELYFVRDE